MRIFISFIYFLISYKLTANSLDTEDKKKLQIILMNTLIMEAFQISQF